MNILSYKNSNFERDIADIFQRSFGWDDPGVESQVANILKEVKSHGDQAVIRYAKEFDNTILAPDNFQVSHRQICISGESLDTKVQDAIKTAYDHIAAFTKKRILKDWSFSPRPGVILGEHFKPLHRVGVYIPGGTAPLISTVLHTVTIAKIAGVKEIILFTPVKGNTEIHPAILYAAGLTGATAVYRFGGAHAIGAMAFGTESIKKVDKIVGPGNHYVAAAKRQVYGHVGIDGIAGPSEIVILSDGTGSAECIAADMLSQAEHGSGLELVVAISTSEKEIKSIQQCLTEKKTMFPRQSMIQNVLEQGTHLIHVKNLEKAAEITNRIAPEHVEIMTSSPRKILPLINVAGAIFLGHWTPETIGDYIAGPSHVLPTGGAARFSSGLTIDQFVRRISIIDYQQDAFEREANLVTCFSTAEQLDAHAHTIDIRYQKA